MRIFADRKVSVAVAAMRSGRPVSAKAAAKSSGAVKSVSTDPLVPPTRKPQVEPEAKAESPKRLKAATMEFFEANPNATDADVEGFLTSRLNKR